MGGESPTLLAEWDGPLQMPRGMRRVEFIISIYPALAVCVLRAASEKAPPGQKGWGGGRGLAKKKTLLCAFEWRSVWNINARGVCRCRICTNVITPSEESWVHSYYHTFLVVKQPQALRRASYFNVPRPQLNQVAQKTLMAVENIPSNLNLTKSRNRK